MNFSLALAALTMGLIGGPHCIAMCGAACVGVSQAAAPRNQWGLALFQLGRLAGYSALGAVAAASMQSLGWLSIHAAVLRPIWIMLHVAAFVIGATLLLLGRQPLWLDNGARRIWSRVRINTQRWGLVSPLVIGALWAFMPCGLLYTAVALAALGRRTTTGAAIMALFAIGSALSLWLGPALLLRLGLKGQGQWGMRIAGAALALTACWGLWMDLMREQAPWCAVPGA